LKSDREFLDVKVSPLLVVARAVCPSAGCRHAAVELAGFV